MSMLRGAVAGMLAILAVLVGTVVAGVAVVALVLDRDDVRHLAEGTASAALGRAVALRGDISLDLGATTRLTLQDIAVANAAWGRRPQMATIRRLEVALDLWSLLKRPVVFPEIIIDHPEILLERNAEGEANWAPGGSRGARTQTTHGPASRTDIPVVKQLKVTDGRLELHDQAIGRDLKLALSTLTVTDDRPEQRVHVDADGTIQGAPLRVRLQGGAWAMLQDPDTAYPIDVDLRLADLRARAEGKITDPARLAGLDVRFNVRGDNTRNLFALTGLPLPPSPPYRFAGRIERAGSEWRFTAARGQIGSSDMRGDIAVDLGGPRPRLKADLQSDKLLFADLGPFIGGKPGGAEGAKTDSALQQRADGKILPDKAIDLRQLRAMDADISFFGRRIEAPSLPVDQMQVKLTLDDGTLRLQPVELKIGSGSVRSFLSLYGSRSPAVVDVEAFVQNLQMKDLLRGSSFVDETAGTIGGRVKLKSTGSSVASILGTANGELFVVMSSGSISHLLVEAAGLDVAEAIGVLIEGDEPIPVRCIVADFAAEDGVFRSRALVFDTTDTNIAGDATINMREERLDIRLEPLSKDFSPLSVRAPIRVQGTLAEPTVFPDPVGLGVDTTVKKIVNAVLTPLIGLLPPIDAGVGKDSDCRRLIAQARSLQSAPRN